MSYCITVIVLSHLSLKPTYLEKYIIAYETTNGHSEFSPFLLKTVCTVPCRVRVCCSFTHGSSCESPRHPAVYTLHCSRLLPWHRLACCLGCEGSLVPVKGRQNTQTVEASPRPLLQQSSRSLRR